VDPDKRYRLGVVISIASLVTLVAVVVVYYLETK
jgi:hypothetical protein